MTAKVTLAVDVKESEAEILSVLGKYSIIVADIKAIAGTTLVLELEAMSDINIKD